MMIYIEDYRNLPVNPGGMRSWEIPELLGKRLIVRTAAGEHRGVAVLETRDALTLAYIRVVRGRRQNRRIIISKQHIVSIETYLA